MQTIGMIGAGNMGGAILRGAAARGYLKAQQLRVCDLDSNKLEALQRDLPGVICTTDPLEVARESDLLILAVKPGVLGALLESLRIVLMDRPVGMISIAAGWTMQMLNDALSGTSARLMRVMPNTPALVGAGMTAVCKETTFSEEAFAYARGIFDAVGRTVILPEKQFDGVVAISGSSPAYVFMMIEAMADAGVAEGIARKTAYEMAAQAVLGSALMVLNTGSHPGALKDAVCSPAGTTIDAVRELEDRGFRSAIMRAMQICAQKSRDMSEK